MRGPYGGALLARLVEKRGVGTWATGPFGSDIDADLIDKLMEELPFAERVVEMGAPVT